jgi:branched-chain amino acid transport system substrate-binding protein
MMPACKHEGRGAMTIGEKNGLRLILVSLMLILGCQDAPPKPLHPARIRIGAIYPLSGNSAATGEDMRAALELAVTIINQPIDLPIPLAKGKGLPAHGNAPIEIIYQDSQNDETTAAKQVETLIRKDHVVAMMGCYNSAVTAAASEQAEILKTPFLNTSSTSPILTQRGLNWFFRTTPDDSIFAQNFFTFFFDLSQQLGINIPKRLILVYENRLWGTSVSRAERKLALKYDYEIVGDIPYDSTEDAFDEELEAIKAAMPGVILQSSYDTDAIAFMHGYRQKQIMPTAIMAMDAGFVSTSFLEALGKDSEYILSREAWALDIGRKKPIVHTVNELFKEKTGRNMTGHSARAFTGLIVLADAINRAAMLTPEAIRAALQETDLAGDQLIMPWDGVRFDPSTGQNVLGQGIIVQVQGGEYRTVWPLELSANIVVWPFPAWSDQDSGKRRCEQR